MTKRRLLPAFLLMTLIICTALAPAQSSRDLRDQPEKLMDIVGVKPGMIIGEGGAGDGYLTFFLARRVGEKGKIYANDIDVNSLRRLNNRCEREGVTNITTVEGEIADPLFPVDNLDMVVTMYAFHDFTQKVSWLKSVKKYMKPEASLVIFDGYNSHTNLNKERMIELAGQAGFRLTHHEQFHSGLWIHVFHRKGEAAQ